MRCLEKIFPLIFETFHLKWTRQIFSLKLFILWRFVMLYQTTELWTKKLLSNKVLKYKTMRYILHLFNKKCVFWCLRDSQHWNCRTGIHAPEPVGARTRWFGAVRFLTVSTSWKLYHKALKITCLNPSTFDQNKIRDLSKS